MYSGAIENGQMHGTGRLQYANGDVFEVRRRLPLRQKPLYLLQRSAPELPSRTAVRGSR